MPREEYRDRWESEVIAWAATIVFVLYTIPAIALHPVLKALGYPDGMVLRPLCWATDHDWADEYPYGVEPVCLHCDKRRQA